MSSIIDTVNKVKSLEAEKLNLQATFEKLKKMAEEKSETLESDISTLREEIESLKMLIGDQPKPMPTPKEPQETQTLANALKEKVLSESDRLGNQVFEVSPYSRYFDGWLANFQKIISEFETDSNIKLDEIFVKDRSRIFLEIERILAQKKLEESKLSIDEKALADSNDLLVETDKDYDKKTKELGSRRNSEIEGLNNRIRELETEITSQEEKKAKSFKPLAAMSRSLNSMSKEKWNAEKKEASEKLAQAKEELKTVRNKLEETSRVFSIEEEKLDENCKKKKQEINEMIESFQREIERLKTDTSREARISTSKSMADAINNLIQRTQLNT